jgi:cytochrome c2
VGRTGLRAAYHALAALTLLLFVYLRAGPPWALQPRPLAMLCVTLSAYGLAALGGLVLARRDEARRRDRRLALSLAAAVLALAAGALLGPGLSPTLALWAPLLGLLLLLLGQWLDPRLGWTLLAAVALVAALGLGLVRALSEWTRARSQADRAPQVSRSFIRSSLYGLDVTTFANHLPRSAKPRGGLALLADRYLLATGDGQLFAFRPAPGLESLEIRPLAYAVPLNAAEFAEATAGAYRADTLRVGDIVSQELDGAHRIVATHHYWKAAERCWVMRVSSLQGSLQELLADRVGLEWKTEFETKPCLAPPDPSRLPAMGALESGGRLAWIAPDRLLVTFGDHSMDGWNSPIQAPQNTAYSFGKIMLLDLNDGHSEIYSLGHRNPQGLALSSLGQVWSTEHGPEGGDELNLIERGRNYGWPFATFGTEYGSYSWPLLREAREDEEFVEPVYAWAPSIGVSSLMEVTGDRFDHWRGDLVASSLRDRSLWRLRLRGARVAMAERIPFGQRIREVLEARDGTLVVWTDERTIHFVRPAETGDAASAASLYRACAACHVGPEGGRATAPSLEGIVGRTVAADREFQYSQALRDLGGTWTRDRLDAFLADPSGFAPGTSMVLAGMRDAASRKALIDYLASPDSRLDAMPERRTRPEYQEY